MGPTPSPDKDCAEDRKPMELVPPSGAESNCWCLCPQHLLLLSYPHFIFFLSLHPLFLHLSLKKKNACEHLLTWQPSLEVWKGCGEKTRFQDHFGLNSLVPPCAKSGQWAYLCQISEPSRLLSGCKTIYLSFQAGTQQAAGRAQEGHGWQGLSSRSTPWIAAQMNHPDTHLLRPQARNWVQHVQGTPGLWNSGREHRLFQLQRAPTEHLGTSSERDIPCALRNHHMGQTPDKAELALKETWLLWAQIILSPDLTSRKMVLPCPSQPFYIF